jgi:hypothetical protein
VSSRPHGVEINNVRVLTTPSNINVFGLSFIIALSVTLALLDICILRIMIYLARFRRALGPRIDRWVQDGVWQLQRRAYEGEGYRGWTDLEADIPLTNERNLKDLPILWVPGKSPALASLDSGLRDPAVNYAETFGSTSTLGMDRMKKNGMVRTVETKPVRGTENRGLGLVGMFRR